MAVWLRPSPCGRAEDDRALTWSTEKGFAAFAILAPYHGCMATTKITITVDDAVLAGVRAAVDDGRADNVSAYITEATAQRVEREARAEQIERRWGPFSAKAMAWARKAAGALPEPGDEVYLAEIEAERAARHTATSA